eukprot:1157900-Pelagomonas_calceolata.AAC.23
MPDLEIPMEDAVGVQVVQAPEQLPQDALHDMVRHQACGDAEWWEARWKHISILNMVPPRFVEASGLCRMLGFMLEAHLNLKHGVSTVAKQQACGGARHAKWWEAR